jgi:SAM-dependent methyltransferase
MNKDIKGTRQSFDYQWANLKDSPWLLSNPEFRERCEKILLDEIGTTKERIADKHVLDVGCGNGRWSYAFMSLGAEVVAYDFTKSGCRETKSLGIDVVLADALNPPFRPKTFDIVFSFGVLHHTGNLEKAFSENSRLTKPLGLMHVYLYGKKGIRVRIWRFLIQLIPDLELRRAMLSVLLRIRGFLPARKNIIPYSDLHGGFDALSPIINAESDDVSLRMLFVRNGFEKVTLIKPTWCDWQPDVHMQGIKR